MVLWVSDGEVICEALCLVRLQLDGRVRKRNAGFEARFAVDLFKFLVGLRMRFGRRCVARYSVTRLWRGSWKTPCFFLSGKVPARPGQKWREMTSVKRFKKLESRFVGEGFNGVIKLKMLHAISTRLCKRMRSPCQQMTTVGISWQGYTWTILEIKLLWQRWSDTRPTLCSL